MYCFFFKQKTAYEMRISDWSSDVCSSDLPVAELRIAANEASTRAVSVVPLIMPFSIYQKSHTNTFCRCPLCFLAAPGSGQLHACLLGYSFKRDIQRHFVADTGCILAGIKLCTLDDRGGVCRSEERRVGKKGVRT